MMMDTATSCFIAHLSAVIPVHSRSRRRQTKPDRKGTPTTLTFLVCATSEYVANAMAVWIGFFAPLSMSSQATNVVRLPSWLGCARWSTLFWVRRGTGRSRQGAPRPVANTVSLRNNGPEQRPSMAVSLPQRSIGSSVHGKALTSSHSHSRIRNARGHPRASDSSIAQADKTQLVNCETCMTK
uniref:7TM_GPCR_Srx domain-containing protein n=1 Tax=Panagrellus redivivus TaxID=6233 RepID=A0A7E5A0R1_PANRE